MSKRKSMQHVLIKQRSSEIPLPHPPLIVAAGNTCRVPMDIPPTAIDVCGAVMDIFTTSIDAREAVTKIDYLTPIVLLPIA